MDRPPWLSAFQSDLQKQAADGAHAQVSLATVTTDHLPRVRSIGHAGFWSIATTKGRVDSPCPTFTTDSRDNKVAHIFGKDETDRSLPGFDVFGRGSGGGGSVEAVYWLAKVKMQWRLRGKCHLITDGAGDDNLDSGQDNTHDHQQRRQEGLTSSKAAIRPHLVSSDHDSIQDDDSAWEAEVQGYYQRLSREIQISFLRSSFTVGIIVPDEVEMMDLTDATVARRKIWKFEASEHGGQSKWPIIWDNL